MTPGAPALGLALVVALSACGRPSPDPPPPEMFEVRGPPVSREDVIAALRAAGAEEVAEGHETPVSYEFAPDSWIWSWQATQAEGAEADGAGDQLDPTELGELAALFQDPKVRKIRILDWVGGANEVVAEAWGESFSLGEDVDEALGWKIASWWRSEVAESGRAFIGNLLQEDGVVSLTEREGRLSGWFDVGGKAYELLRGSGARYLLLSVDTAQPIPGHSESEVDFGAAAVAAAPAGVDCGQLPDEEVPVDVAVLYTAEARRGYWHSPGPGGLPRREPIRDAIYRHLDAAYASMKTSRVPIELRPTVVEETGYREAGNNEADANAIAVATGAGPVAEIHRLRNDTRSDLVVLVTDNEGECGWAREIGPRVDDAFAAVSWQCFHYYTLAHEIGHLLGARHEPESDPEASPFRFQHGYPGRGARPFRTMMAVSCHLPIGECGRIPYWSTPDPRVTYYRRPVGSPDQHNNACVLARNAPLVASFR